MRALRTFLLGMVSAMVWPAYLGLFAYAARVGPWPRPAARPAAFLLFSLALAAFAAGLNRFLFRPGGWAEAQHKMPPAVARQLRFAGIALGISSLLFLMPRTLLEWGLIAPVDRPIAAASTCRLLLMAQQITAWCVACRIGRRRSALVGWIEAHPAAMGWFGRHRRAVNAAFLATFAATIGLDASGYSFTARRVSTACVQSILLVGACWGIYWLIGRVIDHHAWRWIKAKAANPTVDRSAAGEPEDLAGRLRRLTGWAVPIAGLTVGAWVWGFNMELFHTLGEYHIWRHGDGGITVGDLARAVAVLIVTAVAWRHLADLFALVIFPRMTEDQGVRFAVLTLCRYLALGLGLLAGLSAVHLGPKEIGMVLAALGVGLGFGLQEIVSNFVSGIILLLERPIRVGDTVTVSNQSGRVERINIRATTIINVENKSLIIPNRAFITGDLINWTHKDRIIRASVNVNVANGTDPDRVSDLLLTIARDDADVLRNPVPAAMMESFGDWGLAFVLHVFVPEPVLAGRVKHRLCAQIQRRFQDAGIAIPLPVREIRLHPSIAESPLPAGSAPAPAPAPVSTRVDPPSITPASPHRLAAALAATEPMNRCVDE